MINIKLTEQQFNNVLSKIIKKTINEIGDLTMGKALGSKRANTPNGSKQINNIIKHKLNHFIGKQIPIKLIIENGYGKSYNKYQEDRPNNNLPNKTMMDTLTIHDFKLNFQELSIECKSVLANTPIYMTLDLNGTKKNNFEVDYTPIGYRKFSLYGSSDYNEDEVKNGNNVTVKWGKIVTNRSGAMILKKLSDEIYKISDNNINHIDNSDEISTKSSYDYKQAQNSVSNTRNVHNLNFEI